jgi:hypothetical protein
VNRARALRRNAGDRPERLDRADQLDRAEQAPTNEAADGSVMLEAGLALSIESSGDDDGPAGAACRRHDERPAQMGRMQR